jgi:hypothetical protein
VLVVVPLGAFIAGEDVDFIAGEDVAFFTVAGVFSNRCEENTRKRIITIAPMTASAGMKNFIGSR